MFVRADFWLDLLLDLVTPAQYWHDPTQHQLYVTGQLLSSLENITEKISVFWIRIGFNADPDTAFYLNADPHPGSKTNADPAPGYLSDLAVRKKGAIFTWKYTWCR